MPIKNRFAELHSEITEWRRDIHAHPELMFDTHRTSALVAEKLRAFGCDEVVEGIGRTGVVGVIKGRQSGARTVGLRADMDALPIHEATGLDYASTTPGKMHACGHDGHTAMLLGAAQYLAETRNFSGTAVVIFQPAEEGGGGGDEMCKDGMMERFGIDEVYGMHNWPGVEAGSFAIRPGPFFAATDQFEVVFEGKGGHAAKPHETVDAVLMASQAVVALQSIASRNADPVEQIVVSVTGIRTPMMPYNVIAQTVTIRGTVRSLTKENRALGEKRVPEICEGIAATFGGVARVNYMLGYPVMENHAANTEYAAEVARKLSGDCAVAPLIMGGEDFAYMLEERPGAYILMGNGEGAAVHNPEYNFNDEVIPMGCSWFAEMVETRLPLEG